MINKFAVLLFRLLLYPAVFLKRRFHNEAPDPADPDRGLCNQVKNFLIVNTTGIGDTILTTPAWQVLRKKFPHAFISLMVHEKRKDLVSCNPFIDNIIRYRKFIYFFRLIKEIRRLKIDTAIIFHGNDPDILPLVFLGGAKEIIGYTGRTRLPYFLTTPVQELPDHFITAQIKLVDALDGSFETENPRNFPMPIFPLAESERENAKAFLQKNGLMDRNCIGILPGAGRPYKQWLPERFAAVAAHFLNRHNTDIIIFGSKKELAMAKNIETLLMKFIQKQKARVVIGCGVFNLREAAALMENLKLFITNDSGLLHIAMASGVPTVAIFCPTNPEGLLPSGEHRNLKIIKKEPLCNPCITKRCTDPFCMDQISTEEVIKAAEELYSVTEK